MQLARAARPELIVGLSSARRCPWKVPNWGAMCPRRAAPHWFAPAGGPVLGKPQAHFPPTNTSAAGRGRFCAMLHLSRSLGAVRRFRLLGFGLLGRTPRWPRVPEL